MHLPGSPCLLAPFGDSGVPVGCPSSIFVLGFLSEFFAGFSDLWWFDQGFWDALWRFFGR